MSPKKILSILMLLSISYATHAFKLDTHLWVGSEVVRDLQENGGDRKITIPPFTEEFTVADDIADAITQHPRSYLYGTIGPDAFPDMVGGQMTTHPGVENGWNTDDWFKFILSNRANLKPEELAFAQGYLAHGSADFWAHSYVNTYSGDLFDLAGEIENEKRHYLIEGFINRYTPHAIDVNGLDIGKGHEVIAAYEGTFPAEFISNTLIKNDEVAGQYGILAPHLTVMQLLHKKIPEWIDIVDEQRDPLRQLFEKALNEVLPHWEKEMGARTDVNQAICESNILLADRRDNHNLQLANGFNSGQYHRAGYFSIKDLINPNPVHHVETHADALKDIADTSKDVATESISAAQSLVDAHKQYAGYEAALTIASIEESIDASISVAEAYIHLKSKVIASIQNACDSISEHDDLLKDGSIEGAPFVMTYMLDSYDVSTSVTCESDCGASYIEYLYYFLKMWNAGVNQAIDAYANTSKKVTDTLINHNLGISHAKGALEDWLVCEAPKLLGVTPFTSELVCNVIDNSSELAAEAIRIKLDFDSALAEISILPDIIEKVNDEINQTLESVKDTITGDIIKNNPELEFFQWVIEGGNSATDNAVINDVFSQEYSHNFLVFDYSSDPFSERLLADMAVDNEYFDKQKFGPAYNAVILAKLSLLSASELNRLVTIAGGHGNTYGTTLFDESSPSFNVLFDAVKTIDGNHQWMATTPPQIRRTGPYPTSVGNTSYSSSEGKGFRLYQDQAARRNVFNKIFKGPLAQSIETPSVNGFKAVIPGDYPYRPCVAIPYPDGAKDQSCVMAYLIPILSILN